MRLDILRSPVGNHSAHFIPLGCEIFISAVSFGKVSYRKCHRKKLKGKAFYHILDLREMKWNIYGFVLRENLLLEGLYLIL